MFEKLKKSWREATTAQKIDFILDIICGFGAGAVSGKLIKSMSPGMNRFEKICATIAMSGLGMAAGEIAANAYKPHTETIGNLIDGVNGKKEESKDGKSE